MNDEKNKNLIRLMENGMVKIILSKAIYERETIFRTARKFNDKCVIIVEPHEQSEVAVILQLKDGLNDGIRIIAGDFCNELINQQVLIECEDRYQKIRDVVFQHAFSPVANIKEELSKQ